MLEDLSVDALYHLHLLHPHRFHFDCITTYSSPIHHYPETDEASIIYRLHSPSGQFEILDLTPSPQFQALTLSIPDKLKWKRKKLNRLVPYLNPTSPTTGMRIYLSLESSKPLDSSIHDVSGYVWKLGLTEAKSPFVALQEWDKDSLMPCLFRDVEFESKNWNFIENENSVLFKECDPGDYV